MSECVFPNIFRIEAPLPDSPLKAVNCYIIQSEDRTLVVDTGMNRSACRSAMEAGLKELNVDLSKTDFFLTHFHSDHIGLVTHFATESSTIYFNRPEAEMLRKARAAGGFGGHMNTFGRMAGFSGSELEESLNRHPGMKYEPPNPDVMTILDDGDTFDFGEYRFECVQTPGHSPGHLCLLDREKKLMLCGDHVLNEISPNISAWDKDESPLSDYLVSLDKVYALDVDLALPGHRTPIRDFRGRIDELKDHHKVRLDEVMNVLDGTPLIAYDVASRMTWDIKYDHWDDVGVMQKWFATGEAIAHLRHLERQRLVRSEIRDGRILFSLH